MAVTRDSRNLITSCAAIALNLMYSTFLQHYRYVYQTLSRDATKITGWYLLLYVEIWGNKCLTRKKKCTCGFIINIWYVCEIIAEYRSIHCVLLINILWIAISSEGSCTQLHWKQYRTPVMSTIKTNNIMYTKRRIVNKNQSWCCLCSFSITLVWNVMSSLRI